MGTSLAVIEQNLKPLLPKLQQVLAGRMPVERLARTVLVSCEKTPKLLDCTQQSIFNAAMSAAVLALEVDGVTGQAFLIPYGGVAQLVIGYKGFNTLGARSGYSITAAVVREGDHFEYELGSAAFVRHKPLLPNAGRIVAAWSCATSKRLTPIISILSIDEIMAIKAKSPGAKKSDSPWNDPAIGFGAMSEKSARRRLNRSMPLNAETRDYHLAARMEEAFDEQGKPARIREDGTIIDAEFSALPTRQGDESTPGLSDLSGPKPDAEIEKLKTELIEAAEGGSGVVRSLWGRLSGRQQVALEKFKDETVKPLAEKADKEGAI